ALARVRAGRARELHHVASAGHGADVLAEDSPFFQADHLRIRIVRPRRLDVPSLEAEMNRFVDESLALHLEETSFIGRAGAGGALAVDEKLAEIPLAVARVGNRRLPQIVTDIAPAGDAPSAGENRLLVFKC